MKDLIERLEKATGPDQWLDHLIQEEVGEWTNMGGGRSRHKVTGEVRVMPYGMTPAYTSSLDCALTLVPEGWGLRKLSQQDDGWYCTLTLRGVRPTGNPQERPIATAALALCAAALKARSEA